VQERHVEAVVARQEVGEAPEAGALAGVVGLVVQRPLGLGEDGAHLERRRQEPRQTQEARHVVHVAVDRARDARVLDLDGHVAPVARAGPVDLADGSRGHRRHVEGVEARLPAPTPLGVERQAELARRHGFG
jgi:hypothetical protein